MAREFELSSDVAMSKPEWTLSINDLPPEILSHVFQIIQILTGWLEVCEEDYEDQPSTVISWIRVTWVCGHWRRVAVATPLLWNQIHERRFNYNWIPVFLQRSVGAQLDVDVELYGDSTIMAHPDRRSLSVVLQHLPPYTSSVRSFHFDFSGRSISQSIDELLQPILPQLCSLGTLYLHDHRTLGTSTTAFPTLTRALLPRLHSIALIGLCFPWTSTLYASLRSLTVQWCKVPLPMSELIRILQSSPDLESLCLSHCLTLPPDPAHHRLPSIPMPKLSSMKITGLHLTTSFICDVVSAPSLQDASIRHDCSATASDMNILKELIPANSIFLPLLRRAKRLSFNEGSLRLLLDEVSDDTHHDEWATITEYPASLSIAANVPRGFEVTTITPRTWAAILDVVGNTAHKLTCLNLQLNPAAFTDRNLWRQCFVRLPALEHLEVAPLEKRMSEDAFGVILDMLQCPPDDSPPNGVRCHCPRLVVLGFESVVVTSAAAYALLSSLDRRASQGVPLLHLVFTEPRCWASFDSGGFSQQLLERVKVSSRYIELAHGAVFYEVQKGFKPTPLPDHRMN